MASPNTRIPMPQSPVVDLRTGYPTIEWYRYFAQPSFQSFEFGGVIGLASGGTGQTSARAAFDALAPTTSPGDLIVYDTTTNIRLGIGASGNVLTVVNGTAAWLPPINTVGVTSVAITTPAEITTTGSPITTAGTFALTWTAQAANIVFAGPASGASATPSFRALVVQDIPVDLGRSWVMT